MRIEVLRDADAVAAAGADWIAETARVTVAARGKFSMAVSGGHTPWKMLRALASNNVPWHAVHVFQVDERIAPAGDPDRNLTHLRESLMDRVPLPADQFYPMPVEVDDSDRAAREYERTLQTIAGNPPILDLVHLGLGRDGHTASLIPNDPVLDETNANVGVTGVYQGRRRMTFTFPMLNRSRRILWLVTGHDKADAFARLRDRDASIPAGRIVQDHAVVLVDRAAAGE